jgi:hypothetical protein
LGHGTRISLLFRDSISNSGTGSSNFGEGTIDGAVRRYRMAAYFNGHSNTSVCSDTEYGSTIVITIRVCFVIYWDELKMEYV